MKVNEGLWTGKRRRSQYREDVGDKSEWLKEEKDVVVV